MKLKPNHLGHDGRGTIRSDLHDAKLGQYF